MLVVNFFGGPGSGKSTTAAHLFAQLKDRGHKVELVPEFAKDLTYENRHLTLENQVYILGKQYKRLWAPLRAGVDIVVTDSPLLIGYYYSLQDNSPIGGAMRTLAKELHDSVPSINFWVRRTKPYQAYGRFQTETQACEIDAGMNTMLGALDVGLVEASSDLDRIGELIDQVEAQVKNEVLDDVTSQQAAEILGLSPNTKKRWLESGSFPGSYQDQNGNWKFPISEVLEAKERMEEVRRKIALGDLTPNKSDDDADPPLL